jgi:hypothetical protein
MDQVDRAHHRPSGSVLPSSESIGRIRIGPTISSYHRSGRWVVTSTKWMGRTIDHVHRSVVPLAESMCVIIGLVDWSYHRRSRQVVSSTKWIGRTIDQVHTIGRVNGSSTKWIGRTTDSVHRSEHGPSQWVVSSA